MAYINKFILSCLQNQFSQFGMRITKPSSNLGMESFIEKYPRYAFLGKNKDKILPSFLLEHASHGVIGTITKMPPVSENGQPQREGAYEIWGIDDDILHLLHHLVTCELLFIRPMDDVLDMLGDDASRTLRVIFPECIQRHLVAFEFDDCRDNEIGQTCIVESLSGSCAAFSQRTESWINNPEIGYHDMCDRELFPRTFLFIPASCRNNLMERVLASGNLPLLSSCIAAYPTSSTSALSYPFRIDLSEELTVPTEELLWKYNAEFVANVIKEAVSHELSSVMLLGSAYANITLDGRSLTIPEIFYPTHAFDVTVDAIRSREGDTLADLEKLLTIKRILLGALLDVRLQIRDIQSFEIVDRVAREQSLHNVLRAAYMKAVNIAYE